MIIKEIIDRVSEFKIHPLGFYYLSYMDNDISSSRCHIWLNNKNLPNYNDVHNHSYDLHSVVMMGKIKNNIYRFIEDIYGDIREFDIDYNNGNSCPKLTGRRGLLELEAEFEISCGSKYYLRYGQIHKATVTQYPCVTDVKLVKMDGNIYSYGNYTTEENFHRRQVDIYDCKLILDVLVKL